MGEIIELEQGLRLNPYVNQMERFSESFKYLAEVFTNQRSRLGKYSANDIGEIAVGTEINVCDTCCYGQVCQVKLEHKTRHLVEDLVQTIDEYGEELCVEKKREMQRACGNFAYFQAEVGDAFRELKRRRMWEERMHLNKDASLVMIRIFADAIEEVTRELDASLLEDERLERKISNHLRRAGIRPLKITFFVSEKGRYEIHVSAKAKPGICVATNQIAGIISEVMGRRFIPEVTERFVIKESYGTVVFMERPKFQILCGVEKKEMDGSTISGDNFHMMDIPGGKKVILLSDGMGSGEKAYQESKLVLELAEVLLAGGVSPKHTLEIMNATLVTEKEEVQFATLDMCVIDMYGGEVEFIKAGAASSYIKNRKGISCYPTSSLPLGIITEIEVTQYKKKLEESNFIIMMTDGVSERMPEENKKKYVSECIDAARTKNPNELSKIILENVLLENRGNAQDDMMVIVLGVWERVDA